MDSHSAGARRRETQAQTQTQTQYSDSDTDEHTDHAPGVTLYDKPVSPLMPQSPYMRNSNEYSDKHGSKWQYL